MEASLVGICRAGKNRFDGAPTSRTLRITDNCVYLEPMLVAWPANHATWDPTAASITYDNGHDPAVVIADGDALLIGGSLVVGDGGEGVEPAEETAAIDWVVPPHEACEATEVWGVSGVMGITGDVSGVVVLTLPEKTALGSVNAFVGESFNKVDASVIDGVKELTNIIVGTAKAKLSERGHEYNFSLPKVVVGHNYITDQGENSNVIVIPFACKYGDFILDISIKPMKN